MLRKLAADRWLHWGHESNWLRGVDFPLNERILAIQSIVLNDLMNPQTLRRVQNLALTTDEKDQPITVAEIFRSLTDSIFIDLPKGEKSATEKSSVIRRNLQCAYLRNLSSLVLQGSPPPDARSLARMHLRDIGRRIDQLLSDKKVQLDDTLRAHLEESKELIAKILNAQVQTDLP